MRLCPKCGTTYPDHAYTCGLDGRLLVPATPDAAWVPAATSGLTYNPEPASAPEPDLALGEESTPLPDGNPPAKAGDALDERWQSGFTSICASACASCAMRRGPWPLLMARGLWHRDLKPDNILVGRFGDVYVIDWGLVTVRHGREYRLDLPRIVVESANYEFQVQRHMWSRVFARPGSHSRYSSQRPAHSWKSPCQRHEPRRCGAQ